MSAGVRNLASMTTLGWGASPGYHTRALGRNGEMGVSHHVTGQVSCKERCHLVPRAGMGHVTLPWRPSSLRNVPARTRLGVSPGSSAEGRLCPFSLGNCPFLYNIGSLQYLLPHGLQSPDDLCAWRMDLSRISPPSLSPGTALSMSSHPRQFCDLL